MDFIKNLSTGRTDAKKFLARTKKISQRLTKVSQSPFRENNVAMTAVLRKEMRKLGEVLDFLG
jgi:hypothetical protein